MQNQLDLLLFSIPDEVDGETEECLGCKNQQQGHVCPEDQLHWSQIFSIERMKSEAKLRDDEELPKTFDRDFADSISEVEEVEETVLEHLTSPEASQEK